MWEQRAFYGQVIQLVSPTDGQPIVVPRVWSLCQGCGHQTGVWSLCLWCGTAVKHLYAWVCNHNCAFVAVPWQCQQQPVREDWVRQKQSLLFKKGYENYGGGEGVGRKGKINKLAFIGGCCDLQNLSISHNSLSGVSVRTTHYTEENQVRKLKEKNQRTK